METWSVEQVMAIAPSPAAFAAAEPVADPAAWLAAGTDDRALWGRCGGSGREPYDVVVDHVHLGWRCSCPSRRSPCKHVLALLLRWVRGEVAESPAPPAVEDWLRRRAHTRASVDDRDRRVPGAGDTEGDHPPPAGSSPNRTGASEHVDPTERSNPPDPHDPPDRDRPRDERVGRMRAGLVELDRWLEDRLRTGLADPALARYATWDELAARLVDARAGSLANRVRRLAGLVGVGPDWQDRVLAELGVLHLLVRAALHLPDVPGDLADGVAVAAGWQVLTADVLAGVPETDRWLVAGRSDVREDRIEVRRTWLWGEDTGRWAMVLSFAAYGQHLDESLTVGSVVPADVCRYPGPGLRALVATRHGDPQPAGEIRHATGVADACDRIGRAIAAEPWTEHVAATVRAFPTVLDGRWVLSDRTGSVPVVATADAVSAVVASSLGATVPITVEWTPQGIVPLTVHLPDRTVDVGPRADPSFVGGGR